MKMTERKDRWLQLLAGLFVAAIGVLIVYGILPPEGFISTLKALGVLFGAFLVYVGWCFAYNHLD